MGLTNKQLRQLRPYLVGEQPKTNGEWDMFCPLHGPELSRSASLNVHLNKWFCFAGCGGGSVEDLIELRDRWVQPPSAAATRNGVRSSNEPENVSNAHVAGWHSALMSSDDRIDYLLNRKLTEELIEQYEIGWDSSKHVYTIPVRSESGELLNVRRYNPSPRPGRPKIRNITGMGSPARLYPLSVLQQKPEYIIIGEGEWDILSTLSHGFPAITRTASADTWRQEWSGLFKGMTVYLAHDADRKGVTANNKVARALANIADVRIIQWPFEIAEKHGKDLTDFWNEYSKEDFDALLVGAKKYGEREEVEPPLISVIDAFDATHVGDPVQLEVTVKGKKEPGHSVPHIVSLSCTRDAGTKCNFCPLNPAGGEATLEIKPDNRRILAMIDVNQNNVLQSIGHEYEIPTGKCARLNIQIEKHQSVETLVARPSLDSVDGSKAQDYKTIKMTAVGKHDTNPNNTLRVTGALYANPKTQTNEFLAWDMVQTETSVDHFDLTPDTIELMQIFKAQGSPLRKLREIADEFSKYVTHIVGMPLMHALIDLTFHSALSFRFAGRFEQRGWLDCLIVGDTRTGKSETAAALVRHFGAGEIIAGEMASVAGIVGGAQQLGNEWMITWGAMPINDRRLVVIDEASGLQPEDIAALSDVRASGVAKITKIASEATHARTRLLWLSNPRNARMSDYTYGVDSIRPLIGNNEDIARFDMAMSVSLGDVPAELINRPSEGGTLTYTSAACHTLVLWAWTRQPDQIVWRDDAESVVLSAANDMGRRYTEDPPLVQAANIRLKIARTAIALAARTFSTDSSSELIVVEPRHIVDAVRFMDRLYRIGTFGYAERSAERIADQKEARRNIDATERYLAQIPGLAKFLRGHAKFRRQDLEEILDISREQANSTINRLWEARMIRKENADVRVEPTLHEILRG